MSKETFLTKVLMEPTQDTEYNYKYFKNYSTNELEQQGQCVILSRRYNLITNCDLITVRDCNTNELFRGTQFNFILEVIK